MLEFNFPQSLQLQDGERERHEGNVLWMPEINFPQSLQLQGGERARHEFNV